MPRAMWSGAISFGLVSIPVKLHSAVSKKKVSFNQLQRDTNQRIRYKKVAGDDDVEVTPDDIVKGYKLPSGEYVLIDEDELDALEARESRSIEILEFVDQTSIDPLLYDSAYLLSPDPATTKPYALLVQALERTDKVGIARFVMRSKQHLAAIRAKDGLLVLSTVNYADELNDLSDLEVIEALEEVELKDAELDMAEQLIASLSSDFDHVEHRDTYRDAVMALIEQKASGEEVVMATAAPEPDAEVLDIMAALEASVAATKAKLGSDDGEAAEAKPLKAKAKAKTAKRSSAKSSTAKKTAAKKRKSTSKTKRTTKTAAKKSA